MIYQLNIKTNFFKNCFTKVAGLEQQGTNYCITDTHPTLISSILIGIQKSKFLEESVTIQIQRTLCGFPCMYF